MVAVAMSAALTGCYEKFNEPAPLRRWTREEIAADYQIITIKELRQKFIDNVGQPDNTATYGKYYLVRGNYAIEGRVISNDAYGNFYRSIFIQDPAAVDEGATAEANRRGIEIKIGLPSLNLSYPVGSTMFVICDSLAIGNYRKNLSLGLAEAEGSEYANKYIDVRSLVERFVRRGEPRANSLIANDTLVINSANIAQWATNNLFAPDMSGRLVRFEGAKCTWGTFGTDVFPNFQGTGNQPVSFVTHIATWNLIAEWEEYDRKIAAGEQATPPTSPRPATPANPRPINLTPESVPTWGFVSADRADRFYGNVRFEVGSCPIIIRTSGYSRFALDRVPDNGAIVDMTGIVNLYTSGSGGFAANQLMINDSSDVIKE